jgi:hypothetical protein
MSTSQIAFWIITGIFLPLGLYLIFSRSDRDWVWGTILTVIGIVALIFAIRGLLREESRPEIPKPDVTLRFIYATEPALLLVNQSGAVARDIKWQVTVWNLDLPDRTNPLPILTATFDFIMPRSSGGPQDLFSSQASLLHKGDRLIGSASVSCPDCSRGHTFIVYIVWEQGGWFTEALDKTGGEILMPKRFTKSDIAKYADYLMSLVPQSARAPIGEP